MASLHISHHIRDFDAWLTTFNSFAGFRADGGVIGLSVRQAVDDPHVVAIDLQFDSIEQARAFRRRLETEVWPNAPHLDGTPTVLVLETVDAVV